ncbi:hypothetical protein SAMN06264364_11517 [Quadrisphaera granulorum]|uniref:Uncharacterized protein n=1 Tax=Quadrisphaera granulorum TaxID=317664 RepID=A0A316A7P6_9ACTN|nr:hypothetical protein [Quadrisphaera granulorum]PWJ53000.1 hypothetical protein BXY45_11517 [Quadrisphaera granulorum]SZE97165.1 hypothetical protein SAMN06264364_11517 [Quadrisphaera granulorum]
MDFVTVEALVKRAVFSLVHDGNPAGDEPADVPGSVGQRHLVQELACRVAPLLPQGWTLEYGDGRVEPDLVVRRTNTPGDDDSGGLLAIGVRTASPARRASVADEAWRTLAGFAARGHQHAVVVMLGLDLARGVQPTWQWAACGAAASDPRPVPIFTDVELRSLAVARLQRELQRS